MAVIHRDNLRGFVLAIVGIAAVAVGLISAFAYMALEVLR